jgi:uncharacterized protein (DUF58 family)
VKFIRSIYLTERFFALAIGIAFLFLASYGLPYLYALAWGLLALTCLMVALETFMLYPGKSRLSGHRLCPDRLSNGDDNEIHIYLESRYAFPVKGYMIDEIPFQFQVRNFHIPLTLPPRDKYNHTYMLRPVRRGTYLFGALNIYLSSVIGLVRRRYRFSQDAAVPVYPSFLQMRKYELLAFSSQYSEYGIKKMRRIGYNKEFDHIKEYVRGDDFRTINWKATARKGAIMVNNYQDERSQQVYAVVDKGRVMKMPFEGMTLLDYAINSSLAITNIAIKKGDNAGLITFHHKVATTVPASKRNSQMNVLMESLYHQKTSFKESDYESLYGHIKRKVTKRSLLLLFTNFEGLSSMRRQLPYLRKMAQDHLLITIFFENTELNKLTGQHADSLEDVYVKTVAEKFAYEKKQIVKELHSYGIQSILTSPQNLSVNTINKYLELKARGLI